MTGDCFSQTNNACGLSFPANEDVISNANTNINHYYAKNSPTTNNQNPPLTVLSHKNADGKDRKRRFTKSEEIDNLAVDKYHKNRRGIIYNDLLSSGLAINKKQAQDTLKHFRRKGVLFTLKNQRPQRYYSSSIKSEIIMNELSIKCENIMLEEPTGVNINCNHKNNKLTPVQDTSYTVLGDSGSSIITATDRNDIIIQTLQGYVLPLLPSAPIYIHNLHLKTRVPAACYAQLSLPIYKRNRGKLHSEVIGGKNQVEFIFYPNGTLEALVKCSQMPHKLETEQDRSRILTFFGQIKDRLVLLLKDKEEKIVPDIMEWYLTECDLNKDIKVSDLLHFCGLKIQIKHFDHIFRVYIKSRGPDTICRVEETKRPNKPVIQAINEEFNPYQGIREELDNLRSLVVNANMTAPILDKRERSASVNKLVILEPEVQKCTNM